MAPLSHVAFETTPQRIQAPRLAMDVVCFLGLATPRPAAEIPGDLVAWWAARGYLGDAQKEQGAQTALNRPVPVQSVADYTAVFQTGARLDLQARLRGAPIPDTVPGGLAPLGLVVDGTLIELPLPDSAVSLDALAAHIQASGLVECEVMRAPGEQALRLSRALQDGAGTLAVLAHPGLGFESAQHARAQTVGTVMDAAVQQFFAMGGRKAYVIATGAPLPLFGEPNARAGALAGLMGLTPETQSQSDLTQSLSRGFPPAHSAAADLRGLTHLFALEDPAHLVIPDLPDLVAVDRELAGATDGPARPDAAFAECVPSPATPRTPPLAQVDTPRVDAQGLALWGAAVDRVIRLIRAHRRDMHLLAAVPQGVNGVQVLDALPRSAFVQWVGPYLRTPFSRDLPRQAMPADSVLAGHIATQDQSATPYASLAARRLAEVIAPITRPGPDSAPVTWITQSPHQITLSRDITGSADPAWRAGTASRLAARLIRLAHEVGQDVVFEPINARLMRRITQAFTGALQEVARAGGVSPSRTDPGFQVLCDGRTTAADDIARGIVRAEIMVRPAASIEEIRVSLPFTAQEGRP